MNAQDLMLGSRVAHVRELKAEISALKADNAALRDEISALKSHFDLALLAAEDLRHLPEGGRLHVWDGWNLILGAERAAASRGDLRRQAEDHLAAHPADAVWIVYDGHDENVKTEGRLRISYTGGSGAHRADRFIVDFVRMATYLGLSDRVVVRTHDKDFQKKLPFSVTALGPLRGAARL